MLQLAAAELVRMWENSMFGTWALKAACQTNTTSSAPTNKNPYKWATCQVSAVIPTTAKKGFQHKIHVVS